MRRICLVCMFYLALLPATTRGLGVLAHEAIIDMLWEPTLKPALLARYPGATEEELKKAHAYAYGGAIFPDIGYFPLGSRRFSDLIHYVRNGDLVQNLFDEAQSLYQLAFALGVMTHYEADRRGHSDCTNKAVPRMFPKLKKKYGETVTFEQGCLQHARLEFGFDVVQIASGSYATTAYHDFIGFEINDTVMERAFKKTYGRDLQDMFRSYSLAVSLFRFSVRKVIPELTRDAWKIKNSFIMDLNPLATQQTYIYKVDRHKYKEEFSQPILPSAFITVFIGILPKVSTLSRFNPCMPDSSTEKLFETSLKTILGHCTARYIRLRDKEETPDNINMDTGRETRRGEYKLADEAYYKLLMKLQKKDFEGADEGLKQNISAFYSQGEACLLSKHKEQKIRKALAQMEGHGEALSRDAR